MTAPTRSLYQISGDLAMIEDLLIELGGDITDEQVEALIDSWLAETTEELKSKVDRYGALIKELEARSKARAEEAARLANRSQVDANGARKLKERLLAFFQSHDLKTLETPRFRVGVQLNGGLAPLIITNPDDVPEDYCKVRVEPDNKSIREALEAGKELPFAHLGQRSHSLRIR